MPASDAKALLRAAIRAKIAALSPDVRAAAAQRLCARIQSWPAFLQARCVLLTASLRDEIDLSSLIPAAQALGKRCALPGLDAVHGGYVAREWTRPLEALEVGAYGVREPGADCPLVPFPALDFILVPGLAFTTSGMRLGRGKGFFDRLLSHVPNAVSCGVGFDEQVVPTIPVEPHDMALAYLLTPSREFDCRAAGLKT